MASIIDRSDEIFVGHHKRYYCDVFPIRVVVELTTFGALSKMYSNLLDEDKDEIVRKYYNTKGAFVRTWLHSLSTLRNICAHYGRLYNQRLKITPKLFKVAGKGSVIICCLIICFPSFPICLGFWFMFSYNELEVNKIWNIKEFDKDTCRPMEVAAYYIRRKTPYGI